MATTKAQTQEAPSYNLPIDDEDYPFGIIAASALADMGISHIRFTGIAGREGSESYSAIYAYPYPDGIGEGRFATTNGGPIWEDDDEAVFANHIGWLLSDCENGCELLHASDGSHS